MPWHANDACDFIEKLPHVEGKWPTPTIRLHDSHVLLIVNLFGFRNRDGGRRFTQALFAVARKNAKSTIAAAILLYCFSCEDEPGPQVISAATTGPQARIVFNIAKRMVEKTADLRQQFSLEPFANAIARWENGGSFKPINSKASTQDGLNPSHTVLDEVHAHKTHDLLNVLQSAAGARADPLFLFTTTEGYENPGPWAELREFARQLLHGLFVADHFFVLMFALDDEDDDFDESKWVKANPLAEVNPVLMGELRKAAIDAKQMPGRHAEFKIKRLNRRSSAAGAWVDLVKWKACGGEVDLASLEKFPCSGGLDMASTSDIASFRLVWRIDGIWLTHGWRFVPRAAERKRTERGLVPYAGWIDRGFLIEAGDAITDYDVMVAAILPLRTRFNIQAVAFDSWNARQTAQKLEEGGIKMVEFIQGPKSYHPAMKECERAYTAGALRHGADPVLAWCAANTVARLDANLNMAPDKKRSADKIDDFVALLMAIGISILPGEEAPKFQMFVV